MKEPLVSIAVVAYNSHSSLPRALESILNQTYTNWECIVVDDGSRRELAGLIPDDARFRYCRLERNQGIAVARQHSLEKARGDFLCFLDSDDWYYPRKIEAQVAEFDQDGQLAAIGMPVVVADSNDKLRGILGRQRGTTLIPQLPSDFKFPLPSLMVRLFEAKGVGYRPELRRSSDRDFFWKLLAGRQVKIMEKPYYTYIGHESFRWKGVMVNHRYRRLMLKKNFSGNHLLLGVQLMISYLKCLIYSFAQILGLWNWLRSRRYQIPSAEESRHYFEALNILQK